jgi:hypothetical protein
MRSSLASSRLHAIDLYRHRESKYPLTSVNYGFSQDRLGQSSLMFVGKANNLGHQIGALLGQTPALPTNTRTGWKGLQGTNNLVYYENP